MSKIHSENGYQRLLNWLCILAAMPLIASTALGGRAAALTLDFRSIQVSTAVPLAVATHNFQFTYASSSNVGSVVFEYCDSPVFAYACPSPAGLDTDSAVLTGQTGNTGFSIDATATTTNKIVLTRASAPAATIASSYDFSTITNPSGDNQTTFVRISTHASIDGSGPITDQGAVAFATHTPFNVATDVPPFLKICVGVSVASDCASASGNSLNLGVLSATSANTGQSQFASGTNSITGYNVFVLGTTMTSGVNAIPALASPSPSQPGVSQFGLNLRANSNPTVGQEPSGPGSAAPTANYNGVNLFKFASGDNILNSTLPSDFNRLTVSYLVNRSSGQAAGVYSTTLTYLASADF